MARSGVVNVQELAAVTPHHRSIILCDEYGGKGPLQVTLVAHNALWGAQPAKRESVPLPAQIGQRSSKGVATDLAPFFAEPRDGGAWLIETQTGGVSRTWAADLVSGTYQLPACDTVKVGVWLFSQFASGINASFAASVQPANANAVCRPWTYSCVGFWQLLVAPDDIISQVWVPEAAYRYRARMAMAPVIGQFYNGAGGEASPAEAMSGEGTPGTRFQEGPWYETTPYVSLVAAQFQAAAVGTYYPTITFELRP